MADDETTPCLARCPKRESQPGESSHAASESTPLLPGGQERSPRDGDYRSISSAAESHHDHEHPQKRRRVRWPIVISLTCLCLAVVAILVLGFITPSAVREYAKEAAVIEPIGISIAAFTQSAVRARVRASFSLDASRVQKPFIRNLGRFATWIGREVETGQTDIKVYLPEYGDLLLGVATVPPLKVNVQNGYSNKVDFLADLKAGDINGLRGVANAWLDGRLERLRLKGEASVPLQSGLFKLGSQYISEIFVLQGQDLPDFPDFNVTKLNIDEFQLPDKRKVLAAHISAKVRNKYAVGFTVPSLAFDILVPNCSPGDDYILLGNATTDVIDIRPRTSVAATVTGLVYEVPDALTAVCPGKASSPLDLWVQKYMNGLETFVYIRGGKSPSSSLPTWCERLLRSITFPISIPNKGLSNLIKRFSMSQIHFYLPDPTAEPGTPGAQPKVSALVQAFIDLPDEINVPLNISRVRTLADVFYNRKKLGYINIQKWQNASVHRITEGPDRSPVLLVEFDIKKAPLQIVDEDVFTDVMKRVIFDGEEVALHLKAKVAAELDTALGQFVVRDIPASGNITVKSPLGEGLGDVKPKIDSIRITQTTASSISLEATLNYTNPTNYSANIPYIDMRLAYNGSNVANIVGRNLSVSPGKNPLVTIEGLWNPSNSKGPHGIIAGRDLISRYVSGLNTSVTLSAYSGSIPALPALGRALSILQIEVPVPKLHLPDDDDNDGSPDDHDRPQFIKDATVYLLSSTADFTLLSPLSKTTLFITSINATALYNHTSPVGQIQYDSPFPVPPGSSKTPRLPVEIDFSGAGYEALKKALGGTLKIDSIADIGIKLGEYIETISYWGKGIGAKVRL
ncbi:hypothetical protein LOZ51_005574 [Ophidiomyces ophidiicola]|nr:hypothetical protein LOZ55_002436 [Ophidiomyces ophidiicola]KAI1988093.1 hypothetical protein LOZ51_005574 [Ophidiomyces ophidiicola]KAI1988363.1 hypothetical protein LOZ54_003258 [Ophidiomyces ophidiicola]